MFLSMPLRLLLLGFSLPLGATTLYEQAASSFNTANHITQDLSTISHLHAKASCLTKAYPNEVDRDDVSFMGDQDPVFGDYVTLTLRRTYQLTLLDSGDLGQNKMDTHGEVLEEVLLRKLTRSPGKITWILRNYYKGIESRASFYCWW